MSLEDRRRRRARAPLPCIDGDMNATLIEYMTEGTGPREYSDSAVTHNVKLALSVWHNEPSAAASALRYAYCLLRVLPERIVYYPFAHDIIAAYAYLLQHVGEIDAGLRTVDKALEVIPNVPVTQFLKGYMLLKKNLQVDGIKLLNAVGAANEQFYPWVELVKAMFLQLDRDYDGSIAVCRQVLEDYPDDKPVCLLAHWIRGHAFHYHPRSFASKAADDYKVILEHDPTFRRLLDKPFTKANLHELDEVLLKFLPWNFQPHGTASTDYPHFEGRMCGLDLLGTCLKAKFKLRKRWQEALAEKALLIQQRSIRARREEAEGGAPDGDNDFSVGAKEVASKTAVWGPVSTAAYGKKYRRYWKEEPTNFPLRKEGVAPQPPKKPKRRMSENEVKWRPVGGGFAYGPRRLVQANFSPRSRNSNASDTPQCDFQDDACDKVGSKSPVDRRATEADYSSPRIRRKGTLLTDLPIEKTDAIEVHPGSPRMCKDRLSDDLATEKAPSTPSRPVCMQEEKIPNTHTAGSQEGHVDTNVLTRIADLEKQISEVRHVEKGVGAQASSAPATTRSLADASTSPLVQSQTVLPTNADAGTSPIIPHRTVEADMMSPPSPTMEGVPRAVVVSVTSPRQKNIMSPRARVLAVTSPRPDSEGSFSPLAQATSVTSRNMEECASPRALVVSVTSPRIMSPRARLANSSPRPDSAGSMSPLVQATFTSPQSEGSKVPMLQAQTPIVQGQPVPFLRWKPHEIDTDPQLYAPRGHVPQETPAFGSGAQLLRSPGFGSDFEAFQSPAFGAPDMWAVDETSNPRLANPARDAVGAPMSPSFSSAPQSPTSDPVSPNIFRTAAAPYLGANRPEGTTEFANAWAKTCAPLIPPGKDPSPTHANRGPSPTHAREPVHEAFIYDDDDDEWFGPPAMWAPDECGAEPYSTSEYVPEPYSASESDGDMDAWSEERWIQKAIEKADALLGDMGKTLPKSAPMVARAPQDTLADIAALRGYHQGMPLMEYLCKFGVKNTGGWLHSLDQISKLSDGKAVTQAPCPFVQKSVTPRQRPLRSPRVYSDARLRQNSAPKREKKVVAGWQRY